MAILNMVAQGSWWWGWGNIGEPLNLTVTASWLDVTITWKDNVIWTIPPTTFQKSELVRKIGSAPTSPSDWTLVVTETVMNTYETTGYVDQWLTDWETYYYRVFSYSDLWGISYCDAESVTPTSWWWQPWANTIGYYPLKRDFADASGNGYDLTTSNASISTAGWVDCAYYNTGKAYNLSAPVGTVRTMSAWVYNIYQSDDRAIIWTWSSADNFYAMFLAVSNWKAQISDFHQVWLSWATLTQNVWHNIIAVNDNTSMKIYVDGVLSNSWTHSYTTASTGISVWGKPFSDAYDNLNNCIGYISEAIIEWVAWTDQEVADYFDLTKWNYWIS